MPFNVLYASFDAVPSSKGAAIHIRHTVSAIAAAGCCVELHSLLGTGSTTWPAGIDHREMELEEGHYLDRVLEWADRLAQRIAEGSFDVVHVRSPWEGLAVLTGRENGGYRIVYEVNGLPSIELKYHYPAVGSRRDLTNRLRANERALLTAADRVVTQSHTTARYLRSLGAHGELLRVIPNGADLPDPSRLSTPRPDAPGHRILYLGTTAPWQGVDMLVDALAELGEEWQGTCHIVGGGRKTWLRDLERRIRRAGLEGRVALEGTVDPGDVGTHLYGADLCVAPLTPCDRNITQGCCPLKILDYMAAGRPIVASRLPAVREILTDGETGLLFKPDKPRRLAEALALLMGDGDRARAMGAAARTAAEQRFPWEHHDTSWTALYRELGAPS